MTQGVIQQFLTSFMKQVHGIVISSQKVCFFDTFLHLFPTHILYTFIQYIMSKLKVFIRKQLWVNGQFTINTGYC